MPTKQAPDAAATAAPAEGAGLSRRTFLRRAGAAAGAVVVVGAGGVSYRAYDNGVFSTGDGPAYDAWREWDRGDGPAALVAAAVLAPNPHNSQAWAFHVQDDQIDLFADHDRSTGALDPFGRELQVGLGAALENLLLAAPAHGYRAVTRLRPTPGEPVHAARVELSGGARRRSALYEAIPHRHTDRSPYDSGPVPARSLAAMSALADDLPHARVHWLADPTQLRRTGTLMVAAAEAVTRDRQQSVDGFRLFRSDWDAIQRHKDGLTLDTQGLSELTTVAAKLLPSYSRANGDSFWVDQTRDVHTKTAAAYGIVTVPDARDDAQRLTGGRLLQRIHLWTAANGLSLQHMNQITERADRERQLGLSRRFGDAIQALVPAGSQPLVAFRIGHPRSDDGRRLSPRRPAREVIA
ncbi:MAG TPA: hypothetical protein VLK58_26745 [Conexibacter sp.]|nr:hypothetical protein [Conexibacter sp.]